MAVTMHQALSKPESDTNSFLALVTLPSPLQMNPLSGLTAINHQFFSNQPLYHQKTYSYRFSSHSPFSLTNIITFIDQYPYII